MLLFVNAPFWRLLPATDPLAADPSAIDPSGIGVDAVPGAKLFPYDAGATITITDPDEISYALSPKLGRPFVIVPPGESEPTVSASEAEDQSRNLTTYAHPKLYAASRDGTKDFPFWCSRNTQAATVPAHPAGGDFFAAHAAGLAVVT